MIFNLLSTKKYISKINEYVFDDIGIKTFFDDFYDHNWGDLEDVMLYIPDAEEIKKRQIIFSDFLNDSESKFHVFKRQLKEVKDCLLNYLSSDGGLKTYIFYTKYLRTLIEFIESGKVLLETLSFESIELNNMKNFFINTVEKPEFINLKKDVNNAFIAYDKIKSFIISYKTGNQHMNTYISTSNDLLIEKLDNTMNELGIEIPNNVSNNVKHTLDSYFFNRLEYLYPIEYNTIKYLYEKYNEKIKYDYDTLLTQINYYLKLKSLFVYAKEKNIPYSKVAISSEKVTDINDLSDFTIMNKVEKVTSNYFHYDYDHHIQIVTGANGGGKTTYLRSIGANYIMFCAIGYTFSSNASIYPVKYIHTHFPNDENYKIGYGRLHDEILRIDAIKKDFCEDCLFLSNETFSSTDEETAFKETKKLFSIIEDNHVNMIFITHQQLLLNYIDRNKVNLLNPVVDIDDNNRRTFKIKKVDSEIHAFANDILRKYGLSKDMLDKRRKERNA